MKRRISAIAAVSVMVACSAPNIAYASEVKILGQGNGYVVLSGQDLESLQQTLENIGAGFESGSIVCPVIPEIPEICETPDTSEAPGQPETPEAPSQPETPEAPETPEEVHVYAAEILNLVNQERAKAGLPGLELDLKITDAANVRAREIKQSFSHTRPDRRSFSTALTEQGVSYRGSGENIAWGQKSPEQVMEGWMNSEGHRANILNKNFQKLGVGYYQDENGTNYWVQLFTY
ncbi:MAG: CAP domain-containing protein [Lachnospiraceae bacterium]|nr:CAP domain-containing protein [Lachnospiraceae bacterium]